MICLHCGESITEGMVNDRAVYVDSIGAMHCEDNDGLPAHSPADVAGFVAALANLDAALARVEAASKLLPPLPDGATGVQIIAVGLDERSTAKYCPGGEDELAGWSAYSNGDTEESGPSFAAIGYGSDTPTYYAAAADLEWI